MNQQEWKQKRSQGIGASEVAAAMGLDPYKSPYKLWAEKTRKIPDDLENENMYWGKKLENVIAAEYSKRSGNDIIKFGPTDLNVHPRVPHMFATPDGMIKTFKPGALECKFTDPRFEKEWEGLGPMHYQIQLQAQMAVMDWEWGVLCALIGKRFVSIDQSRNNKFIKAMLKSVKEFWKHVEEDTPPPADGTVSTRQALKILHPDDNGENVKLPKKMIEVVESLNIAKEAIKAAEAAKREAENQIIAAIGDNTFGLLPDGSKMEYKTIEVSAEKEPRKGYKYRRLRYVKPRK